MKRFCYYSTAFALLLLCSNCSLLYYGGANLINAVQRQPGEINEKRVKSIEVLYPNTGLVRGETVKIGVEAIMDKNGNRRIGTVGYAEGDLGWEKYDVTVVGGTFKDGEVTVAENGSSLSNNQVQVTVKLAERPEIKAIVRIPLRYIKQIKLLTGKTENIYPNAGIKVGMIAVLDNGDSVKTKGLLGGTRQWDAYEVVVEGGEFSPRYGRIEVGKPKDHIVYATFTLKNNPKLKERISFQLNYRKHCGARFSGKQGRTGREGKDGRNGRNGMYATSGKSAEDGENGKDGGTGGTGGDGENGPTLEVYARADYQDNLKMTLISVYTKNITTGETQFDQFNADGGSIIIAASGGDGGSGGRGGKGGRGGDGGRGGNDGTGGDGGDAGYGGDGGSPGRGGDGGQITIHLDPSVTPYKELIRYDNSGGSEGYEGQIGSEGYPGTRGTGGREGNDGRHVSRSSGLHMKPIYGNGSDGPKPRIIVEEVVFD